MALDRRTGLVLARDDGRISVGTFHGQESSPTLGTAGCRTLIVGKKGLKVEFVGMWD